MPAPLRCGQRQQVVIWPLILPCMCSLVDAPQCTICVLDAKHSASTWQTSGKLVVDNVRTSANAKAAMRQCCDIPCEVTWSHLM